MIIRLPIHPELNLYRDLNSVNGPPVVLTPTLSHRPPRISWTPLHSWFFVPQFLPRGCKSSVCPFSSLLNPSTNVSSTTVTSNPPVTAGVTLVKGG